MSSNTQIVLNLAGGKVNEMKGTGGGNRPVPAGAYPVVITEAVPHETSNGQSVKFICSVTEGDHAGGTVWIYCGLDFEKAGNRNSWQTALTSMGYEPSDLDRDGLTFMTDDFKSKTAYVRLSVPKDGGDQLNKNFITENDYQRLLSATATAATPGPVAVKVTSAPTIRTATATATTAPAAPMPRVSAPAVKPAVPKANQAASLATFVKQ